MSPDGPYFSLTYDDVAYTPQRGPLIERFQDFLRLHGEGVNVYDLPFLTHSSSTTETGTVESTLWLEELRASRGNSWISRFSSALARFGHLPEDWNSYGAAPPSQDSVLAAKEILEQLWDMRAKPSRIAPSAEEGIVISFLGESARGNIECFNTGETLAAISTADGYVKVWEITSDASATAEALEEILVRTAYRPTAEDVPVVAEG